jgi:hypothetical protein
MLRTTSLTCAALALLATAPIAALETGFREGQVFPDLVLPALNDGRLLSVSAFRGRKVLLISFASW